MATRKQIEIEETVNEVLHTTTNLPSFDDNAPITHTIYALAGYLLKSEIYMNLQFKVTKITGSTESNIADTDKLCLANFPLMSLFRSHDVEINQKPIMPANTLTAYTSQIRVLQEFDKDGRAGILSRSLWYQDLAGYHETWESSGKPNDPYTARHDPIIEGQTVDLYGPLMLDIFRQPQPFPDDVEIRITFNRAPIHFALNGERPPTGTHYRITITKADLCITRLKMAPGTNVYKELGGDIKYPFTSYETVHFNISANNYNINQEYLNGFLPNRSFMILLDQEAYQGQYERNPYKYDHYFPKKMFIRKNQIFSLPTDPFTASRRKIKTVPPTLEELKAISDADEVAKTKASEKAAASLAAYNTKKASSTGGSGISGRFKRHAYPQLDEQRHKKHKSNHHEKRHQDYDDDDDSSYERVSHSQHKKKKHKHPRIDIPHNRKARDAAVEYFEDEESDDDSDYDQPRRRKRRDAAPVETWEMTEYSRLYVENLKVLNNIGSLNSIDMGISYEDFRSGMFIYANDYRADRVESEGKITIPPFGVLRLEMDLHTALTRPILVLCIMEYQRVLTIPANKGDEIRVE